LSRTGAAAIDPIELRISTTDQLFQSLDPFPFREKDLDAAAEDYIVGWARELPRDGPLRIVVHLPHGEAGLPRAAEIGGAVARFFAYRADRQSRDLAELFRIGRIALGVGIAIMVACLLLASLSADYLAPGPLASLVQESFLILGWVANWRPLEIFLYDWWPVVRRRRLYCRLAAAKVELAGY
jgi:hypothetical protein